MIFLKHKANDIESTSEAGAQSFKGIAKASRQALGASGSFYVHQAVFISLLLNCSVVTNTLFFFVLYQM